MLFHWTVTPFVLLQVGQDKILWTNINKKTAFSLSLSHSLFLLQWRHVPAIWILLSQFSVCWGVMKITVEHGLDAPLLQASGMDSKPRHILVMWGELHIDFRVKPVELRLVVRPAWESPLHHPSYPAGPEGDERKKWAGRRRRGRGWRSSFPP